MGAFLSNLFSGSAEASTGEDDSSAESAVKTLDSSDSWKEYFESCKKSNQLLVVDFSASWCGPCRAMEPAVESMARSFTDVVFVKIDVDKLPDVSQEFAVQAMPTFVFLRQGREVYRLVGANKDELERMVGMHKP